MNSIINTLDLELTIELHSIFLSEQKLTVNKKLSSKLYSELNQKINSEFSSQLIRMEIDTMLNGGPSYKTYFNT